MPLIGPKNHRSLAAALAVLAALFATAAWLGALTRVDLLVAGGLVADGTGAPLLRADVAVSGGRITGISRWRYQLARAGQRLNAVGRIVAPGFIDVHTHVEPNIPSSSAFRPSNFLRQGVTTLITGNCGRSTDDVGRLLASLVRHGTYANVATLVGHNTLRHEVMGEAPRAASAGEIDAMARRVRQAMQQGALGVSYGRPYLPGRFADATELERLAAAVVPYDGIAAWHVRDEGVHGIESIGEALRVGRATNVRTHISHLKASGPSQWRQLPARLALLADARTGGLRVTLDAYPYDRSSTTTDVLLPDWALRDNRSAVYAARRDPTVASRLVSEMGAMAHESGWHDFGFVTLASGRPEWLGRTPADLAPADGGRATPLEQQAAVLIDISARGGAQAVFADMLESDVARAVSVPEGAFGSDSAVRDPDAVRPVHPRGLGTFPRVFRKYVRETHALTIEDAVRKATGLPAEIFGLAGRGRLAPGAWADIVVFDASTITDRATYEEPLAEPEGIDQVIVNGVAVIDHGSFTRTPPAGMALGLERQVEVPFFKRLLQRVRAIGARVFRLHSQTSGS